MVAYSFKAQFAEPILAGTKGGTIRADRRRHARPGEELQLYTGMRTKRCRLVARKACLDVQPIRLDFAQREILLAQRLLHGDERIEAFARFDGFGSFDEMLDFWAEEHHAVRWSGWHIRWAPLPDGIA